VILYLNGGDYVIDSLGSHRHLAAEVGRAAVVRTLAIDYRFAPERPFPATVEDTVAAYGSCWIATFSLGRSRWLEMVPVAVSSLE
jgi:acetyl esterase/lipase